MPFLSAGELLSLAHVATELVSPCWLHTLASRALQSVSTTPRSPEANACRMKLIAVVQNEIVPGLRALLDKPEWIGCEAAGRALDAANEVPIRCCVSSHACSNE